MEFTLCDTSKDFSKIFIYILPYLRENMHRVSIELIETRMEVWENED